MIPKRVLMIVFEFPSGNGASVQRIMSVYKSFLESGYIVDVLTAKEYAYEKTSKELTNLLPSNPYGKIIRTMALDALRHLSLKGKHLSFTAKPDRWAKTWVPSAIFAGKKHIEKYPPDLIWSSFPTPSTQTIALKLLEYVDAKWISDLRDPSGYLHQVEIPNSMLFVHEQNKRMNQEADAITCATAEIKTLYESRFPQTRSGVYSIMENGFDQELLDSTKSMISKSTDKSSIFSIDKLSIYYAGVLYSDGRDPEMIFNALKEVKRLFPNQPCELIFQGAGAGSDYKSSILELGLEHVVKFIPGVAFTESLKNMLNADVLLLIQDEKFNKQVPGKIYEYLATGKPILLKTPLNSATHVVGKEHSGVYHASSLDATTEIITDLLHAKFIYDNKNLPIDKNLLYYDRDVSKHSRQHHVENLISIARKLI
jgi:glycosyltransferase involved in cell wall biosynthesis